MTPDTAFGTADPIGGIGLGSFEGAFGGGFQSSASSSNSGGNVDGPSIQFGAGSSGAPAFLIPALVILGAVLYVRGK